MEKSWKMPCDRKYYAQRLSAGRLHPSRLANQSMVIATKRRPRLRSVYKRLAISNNRGITKGLMMGKEDFQAGAPYSIAMVAACPFPANHGSAASIREMSDTLADRGHNVHIVTYPTGQEEIPVRRV